MNATLTQVAFTLGGAYRAQYKNHLWRVYSLTSIGYGDSLAAAVLDCVSRVPSPRGVA